MTNDLTSKTALITGSGRKRVGYVIAEYLANRGYNIAIHYHSSAESANENVRELQGQGVKAAKFKADVTQESDVQNMVADVVSEFASIDVLVTTSSIWNSIPLTEVTANQVLDSFKVNTLGTFLCCQHVGLQMVSQATGGSIVTMGDALIHHPYTDHAAYFTAKGSLPTLTKAFAVELGHRNPNVRVNCIEPGPVMLPKATSEAEQRARVAATLTKTADTPKDVAKTVAFLTDNTMLTGCCIPLDGGRNVAQEHRARQQQA